MATPKFKSAVVLISGSGSNLQAIIDAIANNQLALHLTAVISSEAEAQGLTRADQAGVQTIIVDHRAYQNRQQYDQALIQHIDDLAADFVVLAGFMRILTDRFVEHYLGQLINIHPSLLPQFRGLHTHQRVLEAGHSQHGASVHFVVPELDAGPVILQGAMEVKPGENVKQLAQQVLQIEHKIYPLALHWLAQNRIILKNDTILFDGSILEQSLQYPGCIINKPDSKFAKY